MNARYYEICGAYRAICNFATISRFPLERASRFDAASIVVMTPMIALYTKLSRRQYVVLSLIRLSPVRHFRSGSSARFAFDDGIFQGSFSKRHAVAPSGDSSTYDYVRMGSEAYQIMKRIKLSTREYPITNAITSL